MQAWFELHPRAGGIVACMLGLGLAAVNLAMLHYDSHYFPLLTPFAGIFVLVGLLQAITGVRARRGAGPPYPALNNIAGFLGVGLGFAANWVITGSAF